MKKKIPTLNIIRKNLDGTYGNLVLLSQKTGIEYNKLLRFKEKNPIIRKWIAEEKEKLLDVVEAKITENMLKKGSENSQWRYVNAQGRHRGYGEHVVQEQIVTNVDSAYVSAYKEYGKVRKDLLDKAKKDIKKTSSKEA